MSSLSVLGLIGSAAGLALAGLLLRSAWVCRPPGRVYELRPATVLSAPPAGPGLVERIGGVLLRALAGRRTVPDPLLARRAGRAALQALPVMALGGPLPALLVGGLLFVAPEAAARRRERARVAALAAEMPEVVDLFALALAAGLNVALAVGAVGNRATGSMAAELRLAADEAARGRRLGDALESLAGRCGEATRPLMTLLAAGERYGVPLVESLQRLAIDVRAAERRRIEEVARRLPVKMLFPLVVCILPAFGLLTLGPMLVTSLPSLSF